MELWIRSQDKEALININNIRITNAHRIGRGIDKLIYRIKETSSDTLLGEYTTKERALEVLDEIQDLIKPKMITTSYECEIKDLNKFNFDVEMIPQKTEIQELSTVVYEMPKE